MGSMLLVFAVVGGLVVLGTAACLAEKRDWNGGLCGKCWQHRPWISFDTDSQGGRGYRCEGGHHLWVSYPVDK